MIRSFKYQLKPIKKQEALLSEMLECHRQLYNAALEERINCYKVTGKTPTWYDQKKQLKDIRANDPDVSKWSCSSQHQTLKQLDQTYKNFFSKIKNKEKTSKPRFKSQSRFNTLTIAGNGFGWNYRCNQQQPYPEHSWNFLYVKSVGYLKVYCNKQPEGIIKQVKLTRKKIGKNKFKWFISVVCDKVSQEILPGTGAVVALDIATGNNGLAWTSDGNKIPNPRAHARLEAKISKHQQAQSKCKKYSNRWWKYQYMINALYEKSKNVRADNHHVQAKKLIQENDIICIEKLNLKGMTKRAKPKKDEDGTYLPNGQAAKSGLNKSMLDTAPGYFIQKLKDKAESAGRLVVEVNPRNTSRTCSSCGIIDAEARKGKTFKCSCGHTEDADINAAKNILRLGLSLHESEKLALVAK